MDVKVGDRIELESEHVGEPNRTGEVLEIFYEAERFAYRVRWTDGHVSLIRPTAGAMRVPARHHA